MVFQAGDPVIWRVTGGVKALSADTPTVCSSAFLLVLTVYRTRHLEVMLAAETGWLLRADHIKAPAYKEIPAFLNANAPVVPLPTGLLIPKPRKLRRVHNLRRRICSNDNSVRATDYVHR